ncbi:putative F-box associated interaction domain-containing protein [Helianthus anomalus]
MLAWSAVVGSCNGILCLHYYDNVSLWNLSIRHRVRVPSPPLLSIAAAGFGFDPITYDYKIVAIDFNEHKTCVYSLKTESWRVGVQSLPHLLGYYIGRFQSHIFSMEFCIGFPKNQPQIQFILTFNVSSHVFGRILFPEHWMVKQLTTING